jgi:hypothetical protein
MVTVLLRWQLWWPCVHPLALFASALSSSKRRNENVANERDTCGVRAIHPRPEGRGFPRIPIKIGRKKRYAGFLMVSMWDIGKMNADVHRKRPCFGSAFLR